jgi:hypothetical protein
MSRRKKEASGQPEFPQAPSPGEMPDPKFLFVCEGLTLDEIAARFAGLAGYSRRTLARRSVEEMWQELRRQHLTQARERTRTAASETAPRGETTTGGPHAVTEDIDEGRRAKLGQFRDMAFDAAMLAVHDARKVMLADRIRIFTTTD